MSSNNEEVRRKLCVIIVKGAQATHANNHPLSESPHVIFPNIHMQTKGEAKMQSIMELKK